MAYDRYVPPALRIALAGLLAAACGRVDFAAVTGDAEAPPADAGRCEIATPFQPAVMVAGLNTGAGDITLRLEPDELTGVFWSLRTGDADIFAAQRPDLGSPFTATILPAVSSVGATDSDPTLPADGSFIAFASTRAGGAGGFDLYEAERVASSYTAPMAIASLDTAVNEMNPNYSNAEGALYFDSDVTGTPRIYRSVRSGPATYGTAVMVAELASSDGQEFDPVPSADGLALYFRSTRMGGPGNGDIYVATRPSLATTFGAPALVDSASSPAVDGPSFVSRDQCRLYFTSDRSGAASLYVAAR
jgi:Tol biopolymer transport system component